MMRGLLKRRNFGLLVGSLMLQFLSHRMRGAMDSVHVYRRRNQVVGAASTKDIGYSALEPSVSETQGYIETEKQSFNTSTYHDRAGVSDGRFQDHDLVKFLPLNQTLQKRRKRRLGLNKRRQSTVPPSKLKVPLPIFVPSLPKSGTTSVHKYFSCGGHDSAHLVYKVDGKVKNKIGRCWKQNINRGRPPLEGCGNHDIWSDTGFVNASYRKGQNKKSDKTKNIQCYYPLIEALDQIYASYPNATFLFVTRNETNWLNSIETYHDGFIVDVWKQCRIQGFPGRNATMNDFGTFYRWHKELIRTFARDHPSITYIEVPLEAETTGQLLEERIGVERICWGHHNKQQQKKGAAELARS